VPPELAAVIRPEVPGLADEIIDEIRRAIPEYGPPLDGPFGRAQRAGVVRALMTFADVVEDPATPLDSYAQACREFGRAEARERRSLGLLTGAHRVGFRMAWQRAMEAGHFSQLPAETVSLVCDALFDYLDLLVEWCRDGYLEEKARLERSGESSRTRLLALILERPPVPRRAIDELAEAAGWTVPDEVTMVALTEGARWSPALPDGDLLASLEDPQPQLLVPGQIDRQRRATLEAAMDGRQAAVGLAVPLADAADSLRWARQALALAGTGIIDDGPVTMCEDHLLALWLLRDEALVDQVAGHKFTESLPDGGRQQQWFAETLETWLQTWGSTTKIAERLRIHPQTVRYRIHKLEAALGDQLDDPDARFAMGLILRAKRLRQKANGRV
jgi:hypothetical protein